MTEEHEVKPDQAQGAGEPAADGEQTVELSAKAQTKPSPAGEAETAQKAVEADADDLEALRKHLEEARAKEAEYLDGWQRARAELANARKRFQREQQGAYANAKCDVLVRLLPIIDDFERALAELPDDLSDHSWVEGIKLVQQKAQGLLAQESVEPIDTAGQEFDPLWHQAVTHEPSDQVPAGEVIAEMQRGYRIGERVLRPSMVRVSSGPPPEPELDEKPSPEEQDPGTEEGSEHIKEES